jgi:transcription-repair coupling factor (superfamily II helicase)
MQDLDIRGAGNMLGAEQSGFIADIGFETYHKILDEAIQELKEEEFSDIFSENASSSSEVHNVWNPGTTDCHVETDMELLIPDWYVESVPERMRLYRELDSITKPEELAAFETKLKDRFGSLPEQVVELLNVVQLRWLAQSLGMEKVFLKNQSFVGYFISNQLSPFYRSPVFAGIIAYIQRNPKAFQLKEMRERLSLIASNIKKIQEALEMLKQLEAFLR